MNYQSSNALLGQTASPTCRFLGGSCCCTWPSTSAPPTWLETRSTIFVHFISILVRHGIISACNSTSPSCEHLCTSYLAGDKVNHICPLWYTTVSFGPVKVDHHVASTSTPPNWLETRSTSTVVWLNTILSERSLAFSWYPSLYHIPVITIPTSGKCIFRWSGISSISIRFFQDDHYLYFHMVKR